jgi:uncharacterized membrane protein
MDIWSILITLAIVIWLILAVASNVKHQKIKETISELKDWIEGKVKKK